LKEPSSRLQRAYSVGMYSRRSRTGTQESG